MSSAKYLADLIRPHDQSLTAVYFVKIDHMTVDLIGECVAFESSCSPYGFRSLRLVN